MGRKRIWVAASLLPLYLALLPSHAAASVLSISDDGEVAVYDGPTAFSDSGASPVAAPAPVVSPRTPAATPGAVSQAIVAAAERYAVSVDLIEAVAWQESRFRVSAVSNKGAVGVMQLMPDTARALGVDPYDALQNVHGGAAYLSQMLRRYDGDIARALAAYNAGPGAVDRYGGVPPFRETRAYVAAILNRLAEKAAVSVAP